MDAIDDLGNVLLLIQIDELETEQIWQPHIFQEPEESDDVVGVTELQLLIAKDS